jgi:protocatechuate 3,4-dioxygenase beta subunit
MRTATGAFVICLLTAATASAQVPPPPPTPPVGVPGMPQRDAAKPKTGTAMLKGRVLSAETGKPLRRAQVRAGGTDPREARSVSTDENGAWELRELPAGKYTIQVSKGGYVTLAYGQRRPFEQGKPIDLADGQTVDKLDVSLPRGSVITGRLYDEFGEPISGARVSAMRNRFMGGVRRLMPFGGGSTDTTDDIGQFRLHGLSPGDYYISASSGTMVSLDRSEDRTGYAVTYYPGTPVLSEAQKVTVAQAQETQGITFSMSPTRVATISGTVTSSTGKPLANSMVMLVNPNMTGGTPLAKSSMTRADGGFTLSNVEPGDYVLQSQMMDLAAVAATGSTAAASITESASMPLTVQGRDITGLSLVTGATSTARGTITLVGGAAGALPGSVMLAAAPPTPMVMTFAGQVRINDDWTFEATGLTGRRLFRGLGPGGWILKSVTLNGNDVTDTGIEFRPGEDVSGIEIELAKELSTLAGRVTAPKGEPATDYTVVAFSPDSARWAYLTRFVKVGRPDQSGGFTIAGLPAGDYLVAAVEYLEPGEEQDPDVLERLRAVATSISLKETEKKTLTLKLSAQ